MRVVVSCLGFLLLFSTASASPLNTIDDTTLFIDFFTDDDYDGAYALGVDGLEFDLSTAGGYALTGILRVSPVQSLNGNGVTAQGFSPQSAPLSFELPLFVDLTETTLTCTLQQGSCGEFEINYSVWLSVDLAEETISARSLIDGFGPAGFDLDFASGISVLDVDFAQIAEISSMNVIPIPETGVIDFHGFSGVLDVSGAKTINFSQRLQSSTGLSAGESLLLPNSFTTTVSAVPEPSSVWMLLGGAAAVVWLRKRQRPV